MKLAEIRQKFLNFFQAKGHTVVPSSSLVPDNDDSLLFTNAGMVQFKNVLTGAEVRPYTSAVSSQRSIRAGGKHNDLENVGYTSRHHTFFEMLGNFSFGSYFKSKAIHYAWELLTNVYQIPTQKIWVTVYYKDSESYDVWAKEIGLPEKKIIRINDKKDGSYSSDNFWQMGDFGPCGPSSEIFYDRGPDFPGDLPGSPRPGGERYIEIWNLVFMQFERDRAGKMLLLPKQCVDTGMGLERLASILQNVRSNYDIDLFKNLISAAAHLTSSADLNSNSLKIIADHIRSATFLITDGVVPGNEGRGYVLRRIIRRALRHGYQLGKKDLFFHLLVDNLVMEMGTAYPELILHAKKVSQVIKKEEECFCRTLTHGIKILQNNLVGLPKGAQLGGDTIFTLYDTYGFPVDLTADICREHKVEIDIPGFNDAMYRQQKKARLANRFKTNERLRYTGKKTDFQGYIALELRDVEIVAIYVDGVSAKKIDTAQPCIIVLNATPFYAESGGQVGDVGFLKSSDTIVFAVENTYKIQTGVFGHSGILKCGNLELGDRISAVVDKSQRYRIACNHSATHLLHKALRRVLGTHAHQQGSLVNAEKLRFDFIHDSPLDKKQIVEIESAVNAEIFTNQPTRVRSMDYGEAIREGAVALFEKQYQDKVRVVNIGSSCELCGGTHVSRTGDIGLFKIISESSVASGVRRIEAITGEATLAWVQKQTLQLEEITRVLGGVPTGDAVDRISQLKKRIKTSEHNITQMRAMLATYMGRELVKHAIEIRGVTVLTVEVKKSSPEYLRIIVEQLTSKLNPLVILLACIVNKNTMHFVGGVTEELHNKINAVDLVNFVSSKSGGKGKGNAAIAVGNSYQVSGLPGAISRIPPWLEERLQA